MRLIVLTLAVVVALGPTSGRAAQSPGSYEKMGAKSGGSGGVTGAGLPAGEGQAASPILVEGPAPGLALVVPRTKVWLQREREIRGTTFAFAGLAGASLIGLIATSVALARPRPESPTLEGLRAGRMLSALFLGVSAVGGIGSWMALERHRHPQASATSSPPSPPPWAPHRYPDVMAGNVDPRTVPAWVQRDRGLTRGMIATGSIAGGSVLGAILAGVIGDAVTRARCGTNCFEGNLDQVLAIVSLSALAGVSLAALGAVSIARAVHRRPLRSWDPLAAAGGLQFRF